MPQSSAGHLGTPPLPQEVHSPVGGDGWKDGKVYMLPRVSLGALAPKEKFPSGGRMPGPIEAITNCSGMKF